MKISKLRKLRLVVFCLSLSMLFIISGVISGTTNFKNFKLHTSDDQDFLDWGVDDINAEIVWGGVEDATDIDITSGHYTGEGVKVLILDSGIYFKDQENGIVHDDLNENYVEGWDFVNPDGDDTPEDLLGHGTLVAGIICAGDNEFGVIGVAPKVELYVAKVINNAGYTINSVVDDAIQWGINKNVDIISMSFGCEENTDISQAIDAAYEAGIVLVASSGNYWNLLKDDYEDYYPHPQVLVRHPATNDKVIAVGAVKKLGEESWGRWHEEYREDGLNQPTFVEGSCFGEELDIYAPGVDIYSTYNNGGYESGTGTSFACPMVAGVVALMLSKDAELSPEQVKIILPYTATVILNAEEAVSVTGMDGSPPTVEITYPLDANPPPVLVYEPITVKALAADAEEIRNVQFRIDNDPWQDGEYDQIIGDAEEWRWEWDNTEDYSLGYHTIWSRVIDYEFNIAKDSVQVEVSRGYLPTVEITSPPDASPPPPVPQYVHITVKALAADVEGITKVQFRIDNDPWQDGEYDQIIGDAEEWRWEWDNTEDYSLGYHTIWSRVIDSQNNIATDSVQVRVTSPTQNQLSPNGGVKIFGGSVIGDYSDVFTDNDIYYSIRHLYDGGWWFWTTWRAEVEFSFDYNSEWTYELMCIQTQNYNGYVQIMFIYSDQTNSGWIQIGLGNQYIILDTDKAIEKVRVKNVYIGPSAPWLSIDYLWLTYYP